MGNKADVWQGTLALMILRTLDTLGPQHGYGIARRIEAISGDALSVNYGTSASGAAETRAGRRDCVRMGAVRERPPREVLPAHTRWPCRDGTRLARLGPDDGNHGAIPGRRR